MILILTCDNCRRTSAVQAVIDKVDFPREETWLLWDCVRCNKAHQWLIPSGRSLEDTAKQSLKSSSAYSKVGEREDVYQRLSNALPETHRKILFGELTWWWRQEVAGDLTIAKVARAADITVRQWIRIEAGASMPHQKNLVGIVHAVDGIMDQAYMLIGSDKDWAKELERYLADEEERISRDALFQKEPEGYTLQAWESPDVEAALQALRRVLPFEFDEDHFLFYAYMVHQGYWGRQLGGPITMDDTRAEIIPVIKKLFNLFGRCENKQAQYRIVYLMVRGAKAYMTQSVMVSLVIYFIRRSFTSAIGEDETSSRVGEQWEYLSPTEKIALTLFDLIDPQYQPRFIKACQKLQGSAKGIDYWLSE